MLISAVILSGLVSQWILGSYLYLGYPTVEPFGFLPLAALTGTIYGLGGAIFGKTLQLLVVQRARIKKRWKLGVLAVLAGLSMGLMGVLIGDRAISSGNELMSDLLFRSGGFAGWQWAGICFVRGGDGISDSDLEPFVG